MGRRAFGGSNGRRTGDFICHAPCKLGRGACNRQGKVEGTSHLVGLTFLVLLFVSDFTTCVPLLVLIVTKFSCGRTMNVLASPCGRRVFRVFVSYALFLLPFVLVYGLDGRGMDRVIGFSGPSGGG